MKILGLSCYYHDSAAAIVVNGQTIVAAQEERFSRIKQDAAFPAQAIKACLKNSGLSWSELDGVAFYEKPFLHFDRLLETYLAFAPRGYASFRRSVPEWLRKKLFLRRTLIRELRELSADMDEQKLFFSEHHLSHAASAFFPSPFEEAAILTMDGVGEWATTSMAIGRGNRIERKKVIQFPHSIGLLYSAFTQYAGFKVNSGEYKLMGLAPYGTARFAQTILTELVDLREDGSFGLNLRYFDFCTGLSMINQRFEDLFGAPMRKPEAAMSQHTKDIAASIQFVLEEIVVRMATHLRSETGLKNLCLSGGVALNCVANSKILKLGKFDRLWIQPASGDDGGAIGAALAIEHLHFGSPRTANDVDAMKGAYLGLEYSSEEADQALRQAGAVFETLPMTDVIQKAATALAAGDVVGWHQGRSEFGPRSLGNRAILADPRSPDMKAKLNRKIKFRESFRPFAPAVLRERVSDWFDLSVENPYMLLTAQVKDRHIVNGVSEIPAVTHVDYSARLQTVQPETNPLFHQLLVEFERQTGCPILINTSFNVRSEPIVETPADAFRCFMGTDIDVMVVGPHYLEKRRQDPNLKIRYDSAFKLD